LRKRTRWQKQIEAQPGNQGNAYFQKALSLNPVRPQSVRPGCGNGRQRQERQIRCDGRAPDAVSGDQNEISGYAYGSAHPSADSFRTGATLHDKKYPQEVPD
jgi:hypothetical protein